MNSLYPSLYLLHFGMSNSHLVVRVLYLSHTQDILCSSIWMVWFGWVLWRINHCRLFDAKSPLSLSLSIYIYIYIYVVMLAKERHEEHKKVDRKTYIQVIETRYKWTWLNRSSLIGSWESSVVVTIRPLRKWYHTWLCHMGLVSSIDIYLWRRVNLLCREYNNIFISNISLINTFCG